MIMFVLLCYPVSIHMSQLLSTRRPISSFICLHQRKRLAEPAVDINILHICTRPPVDSLMGVLGLHLS